MKELRRLIRRRTGIGLREERDHSLERFVRGRIDALGLAGVDAYAHRLEMEAVSSEEWRELVAVVSNGHTAFCRDMGQLDVVGETIARLSEERGRSLALWSAGCSTGEEPYTLAMIARRLGVRVDVLGTDIDHEAIAHAQRARYRSWALRRVPTSWRTQQFSEVEEGVWRPVPDVLDAVRLAQHNLLADKQPLPSGGRWDIILCRNVFIYFEAASVKQVLAGFSEVLADDGVIFLGHSDMLHVDRDHLDRYRLARRLRYRQAKLALPPDTRAATKPSPPPTPLPPEPPVPVRTRPAPDEREVLGLVAAGDFERAEQLLLREVGEADPVRLGMLLGNLRLARHDFEGAGIAYDEAHRVDPLNAEIHYLRALLSRRTGQLEHSVECCRHALFLAPDLWPACFLLAGLLARLGARDRSRAEFRHTLSLVQDVRAPTPPLASYMAGLGDLFPAAPDVEAACRFHLDAGASED